MTKKTAATQPPSQTLARGLSILEVFSLERPEWGIRELGRELGFHPTTVFRLVATLQGAGYLEQDTETRRYLLGPKVMKLATMYEQLNPLPTVARRVFESYADQFEHNFYLGTLYQYDVVYVAVLDGRGPIKIATDLGAVTGLHSTAIGKILLAFQDDEFTLGFLEASGLPSFTPRTITDPAILWEQIREIRERGYALNDGEELEDVAAVGVPVYDQTGRVIAALSLAYPRHLAYEKRIQTDALIPLVHEIAHDITVQLGGVPPKRLDDQTNQG